MSGPIISTKGLVSSTAAATALPKVPWAAAAGTSDAITAAFTPANASLFDGLIVAVRLSATNTTTTPTLNVDGLGAHTVVKNFGAAVEPGDLPDEGLFRYKASTTTWWLLNPNAHFRVPTANWVVAAGTADALTATYTPATGALVDGMLFYVKAASANATTTPTFAPDGQTARTIKKLGGNALAAGDIFGANHELILRYHATSTWYELLNPAQTSDLTSSNLAKELVADDSAGTNGSSAQPWFVTTPGVTVKAGTYEFRGRLYLSRAAGSTSHTTATMFGGTATVGTIAGVARGNDGDDTGTTLLAFKTIWFNAATATVVKGASTSTSEQIVLEVDGMVTFTVAGTFIPQYKFSATPGGAATPKAGSYFIMRWIPANPLGTWA